MKSKVFLVLLGFIIFVAAFLRFFNVAKLPASLTWDEAAWGYNAYSIGIDGKDEFGRFLPIDYIESFGDFKPPVYMYLTVLPVKIFGLNEFSTRFASAFFGTLTVLLTYFLVLRLFAADFFSNHKKNVHEKLKPEHFTLALLSAGMLAISPWHILLSRAAFEANVATFFLVFGIYLFIAAIQDKKWYLLVSAVSFVLSMYTFNTSRVFAPLIVLFLAFMFRKKLFEIKTQTIVAAIIGFAILFPIIGFLLSPQAGLRFREVNIFTDPQIVKMANQEIANDKNSTISKIIHNRRFLYSIEYVKHYFDNLSPSFLFIKGDGNPKFSIQNVGQMYLWEIPFFVAGILFLFRKKEGYWWIIPAWLILGIIPAATARETPHALRIETTLPTFQILTSYGIYSLGILFASISFKYKNYDLKKILYPIVLITLSIVVLFNFLYFYHGYFAQYSYAYSGEWQYGYKDSIDYVKSVESQYDQVDVTTKLGRPYIYYLFYTKTAPSSFRSDSLVTRDPFGFVTVESFGKYHFPKDLGDDTDKNKKVLYVNTPDSVPKSAKVLKKFYLVNGDVVLVAYSN